MEAGAHVWVSDSDGDDPWILSEVVSRTSDELKLFQVANPGNSFTRPRFKETSGDEPKELKYEGVELANAKLSDEEKSEGKDDDMITLPHLHEPAILHAIGERFDEGKIYTWTGPVLIAVNPFQRLPLYTSDILESYRQEGLLRSQGMGQAGGPKLGPHIYAIADLSYRQMMSAKRKSQAILISGESGAGKTESTKIVMLYLTTLGTAHIGDDGKQEEADNSIMERVLQSNPILEAFGNARTLRNDNSSRFGKFIELGFSRGGSLLGAKVQTYLLEKVRLGFHASGERNYHIFYQLLRGASDEQKKKYGFHDGDTHGLELVNYYHYTGQGGAPQLREFTDEDGLKYTLKAMKSLGWDEAKIDTVLSLVAGLLHLGQINFNGIENDGGQEIAEVADTKILENAGKLLGVDLQKLKTALTERILITRGDAITIQLAPAKAADSRDALAKTIYGALFLWVVSEVNKCVCWENDSEVRSSTGVLDIFGFECFAVNSFEQLCINFTNEALQQQFNKFIFKMEQAEYEREKIEWAFIAFPDNQDCLDTIQSRPSGILAMLDDECRLGARGNDRNWADRLYKHFIPEKNQVESENTRFSATPIQKSRSIFCVRHFAGIVQYTAVTGFLEKNKDEIPVTAQNLFDTSESWLIKDIYAIQKKESEERAPADKPGSKGKPARAKTVGQQFKEQLNSLMEKIESTEPHYIRCLKPNDAAKPKLMTRRRLTEQLRYGGVLEAVRVARMGYPVRLNHELFFQQYRMLLPTIPEEKLSWSQGGKNVQGLCVRLLDILLEEGAKDHAAGAKSVDEEGISRSEKIRRMQMQPIPMIFPKSDVQLGDTKIFMRKPAHDALEAHRVFHQNASATILQAWIRGMQKRVRHLILCDAILTAQRFYRGCKGRERWWRLREAVAGNLLTNTFRMLISWRSYNRSKKGTILLQAAYRGHATRRTLATTKIQTSSRMHTQRSMYRKLKSASIALQCCQRRGMAKKVLTALKGEQKDIGKLKENNEKLKLEMASLKAMLSAQAKGDASRQESEMELKEKEKQILHLEKRIAHLEAELEKEKALVKQFEREIEDQKLQSEKDHERIKVLQEKNQNLQLQKSSIPARHEIREPLSYEQPKEASLHTPKEQLSPKQQENISDAVNTPVRTIVQKVIDPQALEEHKALVRKLEMELDAERRSRREADGEVIKLRAEISGVKLNDVDVNALLPSAEEDKRNSAEPSFTPLLGLEDAVQDRSDIDSEDITKENEIRSLTNGDMIPAPVGVAPEVTGAEEPDPSSSSDVPEGTPGRGIQRITLSVATTEVTEKTKDESKSSKDLHLQSNSAVNNSDLSVEIENPKTSFLKSPSEYFPMIRRGFQLGEDKDEQDKEVVAVGWKVEVTNRKEREEVLRDEVHRFEFKMRKFCPTFEQGIEVTMWQLNRHAEYAYVRDEFALKSTPIQVKLLRRGERLVQAAIVFTMKGGYLSKALSRRKVDKSALEPLSLHEIIEIKAGCDGYDHTELPVTGKSKKGDKKHNSLFLTLKASPTPMASSRSYFLKFKSRSARNDMLMGLRALLADLQIHDGVGISTIHTPAPQDGRNTRRMPGSKQVENGGSIPPPSKDSNVMIPLSEVHKAIDKERESYDRLLLMLLQGTFDLKEKEDEMLVLRGKLDSVISESEEKDRIQTNDSKLIMQLSKKLETLLMDNEDLRDQNDRLNNRLVTVECEKMNMLSG